MGRPTLLTPELAQDIALRVRAGASLEVGAGSAGISTSALMRWLQVARALSRGDRSRRGLYLEFLEAIEKARHEAHMYALGTIRKAMDKHWQAAAWFLERRYPQEYGRAERVDLERILATMLFVMAQEVDDRSAVSRVAAKLVSALGLEIEPIPALAAGDDGAPVRRVVVVRAEPPADAVR